MNPGAGAEILEDLPKAVMLHQHWWFLHHVHAGKAARNMLKPVSNSH